MTELENSNVDRRITAIFSETEELLSDWSIDRVLSLGAHLELIDAIRSDIGEGEISDVVQKRVSIFCTNLRLFVNSFDDWHLYVRQSVDFAIEAQSSLNEMTRSITQISEILSNKDCVEPLIASRLKAFIAVSMRSGKNKAAVGIMSALRSITNIGISLAGFSDSIKIDLSKLNTSIKAQKLGRLCCSILPKLIELAKIIPTLAWLEPHAEHIKEFCKALKELSVVR